MDTWFAPGTPARVQEVLESYRTSGKLIRLFYGDTATGRDSMDDERVVGTISRSNRGMRHPLLTVPDEGRPYPLRTDLIVRLMDAETGVELYRTPNYQLPQLEIKPVRDQKMRAKGLHFEVADGDGLVQGRFPSVFRAAEYVEFITGYLPVMRTQNSGAVHP